MRPIGNKIILRFDISQKETLHYGTLKLYIPNRGGLSENGRESWATLATCVHGGKTDLKEGDLVVLVHTILDNPACWIDRKGDIITLTLPADGSETIYGKVGDKGEIIPMFGHLVAKRIDEAHVSEIIITPDAYKKVEPNKGIVVAASKDSQYHEGQTIIYHKYSDYELCYNVSGEERKAIMVKKEDVVGTYN